MTPLTIMTWLWRQTPDKAGYFSGNGAAEKVNIWAASLRRNSSMPLDIACVTDEAEGLDPSIRIIPLPTHFLDVKCKFWKEAAGLPQCYRRLVMFAPFAAEIFGAERFVSMDLDSVITGPIDSLFDHDCPFVMFGGTSKQRPYNGSMIQMTAGARSVVWERFSADPEGLAHEARRKYIGSDQAVISLVLGWGEERWTAKDGVEAYGQGFIRRNGGQPRRMRLADDVKMVFFPGAAKPWQLVGRAAFVDQHWHAGESHRPGARHGPIQRRTVARTPLFYAYDDPKKWGRLFKHAADEATRRPTRLFIHPQRVPAGSRAFVRLDQQAKQRDVSRRMIIDLNRNGVITLPTLQEARWYDDKVAQLPALEDWMPTTIVTKDRAKAEAVIESIAAGEHELTFPIISKAKEGSSSATVRMLKSAEEARAELEQVFGRGIVQRYGRVQSGYVYWQRFVDENPRDYRICIVGEFFYGLVRNNRPGSFTASGSGDFYPVTLADDRELAAAKLAIEIAGSIKTQWMAFDVVFDGERPLVLEMSSAWTMKAYHDCPMFDFSLKRANRIGADSFRVAVEVLSSMTEPATREDQGKQAAAG